MIVKIYNDIMIDTSPIQPNEYYKISELCRINSFLQKKHWHWLTKMCREGKIDAINVTKGQTNPVTGKPKVESYLLKGDTVIAFLEKL